MAGLVLQVQRELLGLFKMKKSFDFTEVVVKWLGVGDWFYSSEC